MTAPSERDERKEFEAWANTRGEYKHFPQRLLRLAEDRDKYLFGWVEIAWQAWQARAQASGSGWREGMEEAAKICDSDGDAPSHCAAGAIRALIED